MMRQCIFQRIVLCVFAAMAIGSGSIYAQVPDSLFIKANNQYDSGNFEAAAALYEQISDSGFVATDLYFNLGNTYFKMNSIAKAILNYERALLLSPQNDDAKFNLEMVRTFTVDRIEPLPEFILTTWYRNFRNFFSPTGWAYFSVSFFAIALIMFTLFWFSHGRIIKRFSFSMAIVFLLFSATTIIFAAQENVKYSSRSEAIVMNPVVAVKSSPGETGKDIFILHSGTKVKITKSIGDWDEIKIADGNKGWIRKADIERI